MFHASRYKLIQELVTIFWIGEGTFIQFTKPFVAISGENTVDEIGQT